MGGGLPPAWPHPAVAPLPRATSEVPDAVAVLVHRPRWVRRGPGRELVEPCSCQQRGSPIHN
eukprot:15474017-Alexandrium_andersonii.AAC.1